MKRSRPVRRAPPKRSTTPIRTRRVSKRFKARRCRPFLDWLKQQPCCVTGKRTGGCYMVPAYGTIGFGYVQVDPAHIKCRSTGGDDLYIAVPLSRHLHDEQNSWNCGIKTFQRKYGVDLLKIAREHTERFLALGPVPRQEPEP